MANKLTPAVYGAVQTLRQAEVITADQALDLIERAVTGPSRASTTKHTPTGESPIKDILPSTRTRTPNLAAKTAQRLSRSLSQFCKNKTHVNVYRDELAAKAAKLGVTPQQYIDWSLGHNRMVQLKSDDLGERYRIYALSEVLKLDVYAKTPTKTLARTFGANMTTINAIRRKLGKGVGRGRHV